MRKNGVTDLEIFKEENMNRRMIEEEIDRLIDGVLDTFLRRTKDHIDRVFYFYWLAVKNEIVPEDMIDWEGIVEHDKDKLDPYNLERQALRYCIPEDEMTETDLKDIDDVVREHVKNNPHHPEYWCEGDYDDKNLDCSDMPISEIYIMMADCTATSEEKSGKSARDWFKKSVVNVGGDRWIFSDEQLKVIEKCLDFFEDKIDPKMKRDYGFEPSFDPAKNSEEKN